MSSEKIIGIIKTGNSGSVENALETLGFNTLVSGEPEKLSRCGVLVLPGVGAFGESMKSLSSLKQFILKWKKPFLGICLGMQVLFETSEESPGVAGLGILKGSVNQFQKIRVPQIGWNKVTNVKGPLFQKPGYAYFVNSYYCVPDELTGTSTTDYGIAFTSSVRKRNYYGVQFHPEKSGEYGFEILENFARLSE